MLEIGPGISYVYKGDVGGFTEEGLVLAREMLNRDIPEAEEIDEALGRIIDGPDGAGIVKELRAEGKTLFGATSSLRQNAPEGLLYAKGSSIESEISGDRFSVVRMGIWIVKAGEKPPLQQIEMREQQRSSIRKFFLDGGFKTPNPEKDEDGMEWGIPITRYTTIVPIYPQEGDIQENFIYGHRKDLLAVAALDVPEELRSKITELVQMYHLDEDLDTLIGAEEEKKSEYGF